MLIDSGSGPSLFDAVAARQVEPFASVIDSTEQALVGIHQDSRAALSGEYAVTLRLESLDGEGELILGDLNMHKAATGRRSVLSASHLWDLYGISMKTEPHMVLEHVESGKCVKLVRRGKLYFARARAVARGASGDLRRAPHAKHESVAAEQSASPSMSDPPAEATPA